MMIKKKMISLKCYNYQMMPMQKLNAIVLSGFWCMKHVYNLCLTDICCQSPNYQEVSIDIMHLDQQRQRAIRK